MLVEFDTIHRPGLENTQADAVLSVLIQQLRLGRRTVLTLVLPCVTGVQNFNTCLWTQTLVYCMSSISSITGVSNN